MAAILNFSLAMLMEKKFQLSLTLNGTLPPPTTIYTSTANCHQHKITEFSIDLGDNATNEWLCGKTEYSGY